jgi:hypothetical protein
VHSHGSGASGIGENDEGIPARFKGPPRPVRISWRAVQELSDRLVNGLPQSGIRGSAELETMLCLDEDVPAAIRDGANVIHLMTSLAADLLHVRSTHPPVSGQRQPRDQVSAEPRKSA